MQIILCPVIFFVYSLSGVFAVENSLDVKLRYFVKGNGFHRTFQFEIDTGNFTNDYCHIGLFLKLPSALYVNVDELADIRRTKKSLLCSEGEIDVELFAEKAKDQNFSACSTLESQNSSFFVPIHQRYQYPISKGHYVDIEFPEPKVLLNCKNFKNHNSDVKLCSPCSEVAKNWQEITYKSENKTYVWQVPVGETSDYHLVTFFTLLTTLLGTVYLLKTIARKQISAARERKDQKRE